MGSNLYGVPMCTGVFGLQYSTDILREAGISEDKWEPQTWAEFLANCAAVDTYAKANSKDYSGFIMSVLGMSGAFRAQPFMRQAGGDFLDANGNVAVDSAANVEAFEFLRELAKYAYDGSLQEGADSTIQANFLNGKAAYSMDFQATLIDAGANLKSCAMPKTDGEDTRTGNSFVGNALFGVTRASKNKAAAKAFLAYLTSEEIQLELMKQDGRLPVNVKTLESDEIREVNPAMNPYIDMLIAGGFHGSLPSFDTNTSKIWEKWDTFFRAVLGGTGDIQTLATALKNDINGFLAD